ncbi:aminopeptidase [bacterium]|nr:aminopeptidase [candidate division CSSED10-310 bacterium]
MDYAELAPLLVKDALRIKENELIEITLTGEKDYFSFVDEFTLCVSKVGAFPTIRLNTPSYRRRYLKEIPEKFLNRTPPHALRRIKDFHRHINIIADDPDPMFKDVSTRKYQISKEARRPIDEQIQRRNMSSLYLPTPELADFFKIPRELFVDYLQKSLFIDYDALRKQCKALALLLKKSKRAIKIITGDQFELEFFITGRPIFIEDGSRNLPAGSVFLAPLEQSVNGSVLLDSVNLNGKTISGLILNFNNGRIESTSAEKNHRIFQQRLSNAYGDKDVFAGFGFGLNAGIDKPIGCEIVDTRVLGSIHICIGSNLIFGGKNFSDLFWTMINSEPTVYIDGKKIIDHSQIIGTLAKF